jgi:nitrogen-specific signal transduction histidine kinase
MSELPEIWTGEEELFATLLSVVQEACATTGDNKLDSWGLSTYTHAMRLLDRAAGRWRVTDIGTRTVIAIKLDQTERNYNGPPYSIVERVFDEYAFGGCKPVETVG